MSQILTQVKTPLWKPGTKSNNIEFLSSFKRLEKEDPEIYKIIDQKEGYICQDHNYEYRVGKNQYGLWVSRRGLNDKPPARPSGFAIEETLTQEEIVILKQFVSLLKVIK